MFINIIINQILKVSYKGLKGGQNENIINYSSNMYYADFANT